MKLKEAFQKLSSLNLQLADIRLLLEHRYRINLNDCFINSEIEIFDQDFQKVYNLLKDDYPVYYIIGFLDVLNIRVFLNETVLIPEIETEEFIYDYIFKNCDLNNKDVLDLCTGSGFISLALKKHYPSANIIASDISNDALATAKKSAEYNQLNIDFRHSDFFDEIHEKFDFIISNPPYIPDNSPYLKAKYSPSLALFAGEDGLDAYRKIFPSIDRYLKSNGVACFELESPNADKIYKLFSTFNQNYEIKIVNDMNDRPRFLVAHNIINRQE